ncbi:AAA family ATPase [Shouchella patagoniensis]|uniref:AAA family ATPase n=1 Tax=Shouchella patagoniensis TaxID=228576 RepID=UPI0009954BBD|nr:AAA family ATPase [Shouchella patagoniensis]
MKLNNIVSVRLENFQSHLDTAVNFDSGLNVIVGQSDSGKTAVLRGIRWALFNQPRGTDFLRVGADFVRVTVILDTGVAIVRERTSSKNRYVIKKQDSEDLVLEGFGSQVPEEVIQAHQMRAFRIDSDHEWQLQIAQQLDGPFLLEQTGSLRAKTIGRMSGAHYLDMAIRDTSKDVYSLSQRTKQKELEVKEATEALIPFERLEQDKNQLDKAFLRLEKAKAAQERLAMLKQLGSKFDRVNTERSMIKDKLKLVQNLRDWEVCYEQVKQLWSKQKMLLKLSEQWSRLMKDSQTCKIWLGKTENMNQAERLHELMYRYAAKWQQTEQIRERKQVISEHQQKLARAMQQTDFLNKIDTERISRVQAKQARKTKLVRLAERLQQLGNDQAVVKKQAERTGQMESAVTLLNETTELTKRHTKLVTLAYSQKELEKRIADGRAFIVKNQHEEKKLEASYNDQLTALGICPTCGQAIHFEGEHTNETS